MDLYIGNLPTNLDSKRLKKLLEIYAASESVKTIKDYTKESSETLFYLKEMERKGREKI